MWLSSELMFFAALFAMYFTIRAVSARRVAARGASTLNLPYSAVFTSILVLSSVTCQIGVFAAERGDVHGAARAGSRSRFFMGTFFVLGQALRVPRNSSTRAPRCPRRPTARSST